MVVVVVVVVPRRRPVGDYRIRSTLVSFMPSRWRARLIAAVISWWREYVAWSWTSSKARWSMFGGTDCFFFWALVALLNWTVVHWPPTGGAAATAAKVFLWGGEGGEGGVDRLGRRGGQG